MGMWFPQSRWFTGVDGPSVLGKVFLNLIKESAGPRVHIDQVPPKCCQKYHCPYIFLGEILYPMCIISNVCSSAFFLFTVFIPVTFTCINLKDCILLYLTRKDVYDVKLIHVYYRTLHRIFCTVLQYICHIYITQRVVIYREVTSAACACYIYSYIYYTDK